MAPFSLAIYTKGLILKKGTIVDSSIISVPSSIKNKEKQRDPEAHQTRKGNAWHFGYKSHIGVDKISGLVHHVEVTAANVHDVTVVPLLLHGEGESVHGDSWYLGVDKREDTIVYYSQGKKIQYKINRRPRLAPKAKSNVGGGRSHRSELRWIASLRWLRGCFYTERRDTEVWKNRPQN